MTRDYMLVCVSVCVTEWVGEISVVCGILYENVVVVHSGLLYLYNCTIRHYILV